MNYNVNTTTSTQDKYEVRELVPFTSNQYQN